MKRYIYNILAAALLALACANCSYETTLADGDFASSGDGKVTLAITPKLQGAEVMAISTRAGSNWAVKENVSKINGYVFVFENDATDGGMCTDDAKLLQMVAFETIGNAANGPIIYVTVDEYSESCYVRLITSMTQEVQTQVNGFVTKKDADAGLSSGTITTFKDYKDISVSLSGYYADGDNPNPNNLTANEAFPLASPGIMMPNGLTEETIAAVNPTIYMVPAASKVDVTSACGFTLQEVTLFNGAKMARMRSTVLQNDGVHVIDKLPLPVNLGGVTQFAAVAAAGNTTAATPIYFFPNEGDDPGSATDISSPSNNTNPTYLIVKGRAAGYNVDGYYKIPIVYKIKILGADGNPTGELSDPTYDIVRNNHYKVLLNKVDNPGYASFDEAVDGVANDISYDIVIDSGNNSTEDTFKDSRAETIVSRNGFFYIELVGSEIFAQGYNTDGVKGNFGLSLTRNDIIDNRYDIPTLYIQATDGITITNDATIADDNFVGTIGFTAKKSGTITLRCGDMLKEIPVHYTETPHIYQSGTTIGGKTFYAVNEIAVDNDAVNYANMVAASGGITENKTYADREFRGKAYPTDMSKGICKVYVKQASNFELNTYYNNTAAGLGGNSATNNIFSDPEVDGLISTYNAKINYQSSGKVYQINDVDRGTRNTVDDVMEKWWIGAANIALTAKGKFTTTFSGSISNKFTTNTKNNWKNITDNSTVNLKATEIGNNHTGGTYDESNSEINDSAILTLTNSAGQKKVYNFNLHQYAAPYIDGLELVDDKYIWNCDAVADCDGWWFNYPKTIATTPTIYNAHYQGGNDPWPDSGWDWVEAPDDKVDEYTGGSTGLEAVKAGVSVVAVPENDPDATEYYFDIKQNNKSSNTNKNQAYFDIRMTNDAGELIYLRLRLRRKD